MSQIKSGIGYSPLTEKIYMGKQNQSKGMWVGEKKDITNQFINVCFAFIGENSFREIKTAGKETAHVLVNIKKDKDSVQKLINKLTKMLPTL